MIALSKSLSRKLYPSFRTHPSTRNPQLFETGCARIACFGIAGTMGRVHLHTGMEQPAWRNSGETYTPEAHDIQMVLQQSGFDLLQASAKLVLTFLMMQSSGVVPRWRRLGKSTLALPSLSS